MGERNIVGGNRDRRILDGLSRRQGIGGLLVSPLPGLRVLPAFLSPTAYAVGYSLFPVGHIRAALRRGLQSFPIYAPRVGQGNAVREDLLSVAPAGAADSHASLNPTADAVGYNLFPVGHIRAA